MASNQRQCIRRRHRATQVVALHLVTALVTQELLCPKYGVQMRLIAFITAGTQIEKILNPIGWSPSPRT